MTYAVIDFETTGFSPAHGHRAVEVGIVLVDHAGRIEDEWHTLLNPGRVVGPTHIHGITASELIGAPEFSAVAPQIDRLLTGRAVVAHNQSFDMRFLAAELARAQMAFPADFMALCTMRWSRRTGGPAKLDEVCAGLGISLRDAHAAVHDARATAEVLAALLPQTNRSHEWQLEAQRAVYRGLGTRRGLLSRLFGRSSSPTNPEHCPVKHRGPRVPISPTGATVTLEPGCRVVMTGNTALPRAEWEALLLGAGLSVGGVTKATAVLVAADPASQSGKARKARQYGIPIVTEAEFAIAFESYRVTLTP